jgi:hypothetical protein
VMGGEFKTIRVKSKQGKTSWVNNEEKKIA